MRVPKSFNLCAHENRWYRWYDIENCFWPGAGKRSSQIDPCLATIVYKPGIYFMAWDPTQPPCPENSAVRYIGQTKIFKRRMEQFGLSAGFWGGRSNGHSAAWRWPKGWRSKLEVAFFPLMVEGLRDHLASGYLHWYEALAIESFLMANEELPRLNVPHNGVIRLK